MKIKTNTIVHWAINVACFGIMGIVWDIQEYRAMKLINKWINEDPNLLIKKIEKIGAYNKLPDEVKEDIKSTLEMSREIIKGSGE